MPEQSLRTFAVELRADEPEDLRASLQESLEASGLKAVVDLDFTPIPGDPTTGVSISSDGDESLDVGALEDFLYSKYGLEASSYRVFSGGGDYDADAPSSTNDKTWALEAMDVLGLHQAGVTGAGVRIAHIDTGYTDHVELHEESNRLRTDLGYDFVDGDDEPLDRRRGREWFFGHGTGTCSVLMSGQGNTLTGVAPEAEVIPYRVASTVALATRRLRRNVARAIDDAVGRGCKVISISMGWGWAGKDLRDSVAQAASKGVLVVAAAGQLGRRTPGLRVIARPAALPGAIAVASCDHVLRASSFSGRGARIDVTALGEYIWRANIKASETDVGRSYGTSYSTAHVAGIAALWLQKHANAHAMRESEGTAMRLALFRQAVRSCGLQPVGGTSAQGSWGAGVMNARTFLDARLEEQKSLHATPVVHGWKDDVEELAALSDELRPAGLAGFVSPTAVRMALLDRFDIRGGDVDAFLADHVDDLITHMGEHPEDAEGLWRLAEGHARSETSARLSPQLVPNLFEGVSGALSSKLA